MSAHPVFNALASADVVCLVLDTTRALAIAEAMDQVDLTGVDAADVRDLRAAADEAARLGAVHAARVAARRPLRVVDGGASQ